MKLVAEIEGESRPLEVRRVGAHVVAEIAGRRYELEARELEAGAYLFLHEGRVYECRVEGAAPAAGTLPARGAREVHVNGRSYSVALVDPKRLRGAQAAGVHGGGRAEVMAPMPGKVVRVMVEAGAEVERGNGLVIVEAMKMQNELKSPKAGVVAEVHASVGATVNAGEVLVVIE